MHVVGLNYYSLQICSLHIDATPHMTSYQEWWGSIFRSHTMTKMINYTNLHWFHLHSTSVKSVAFLATEEVT